MSAGFVLTILGAVVFFHMISAMRSGYTDQLIEKAEKEKDEEYKIVIQYYKNKLLDSLDLSDKRRKSLESVRKETAKLIYELLEEVNPHLEMSSQSEELAKRIKNELTQYSEKNQWIHIYWHIKNVVEKKKASK